MAVAIRNLTGRPLFLALNSGKSVRLSPNGVAEGILDVEVDGNGTIDKLVRQRALAVQAERNGESGEDGWRERPEDR